MKRIDIVTDIETLGTKSDSQIIRLSAIAFNIETGEELSEFDVCIKSLNNDHTKVTLGNIKFWPKANSELLLDIMIRGSIGEYDVINEFIYWVFNLQEKVGKENVYLWSNGILSDSNMIRASCDNHYEDYPIFYRNDRDMRAIVELVSTKLGKSSKEYLSTFNDDGLIKYDALDDCRYQARVISDAWNTLIK